MTVTPPIEHVPAVAPLPDSDALAVYLSITGTISNDTLAMLEAACTQAADYELGRCSYARMQADGASPPDTVPSPVARAVLMRAAAIYRRRNSINGFDGYEDLGTVPVRASDPDIERMISRWLALAWA